MKTQQKKDYKSLYVLIAMLVFIDITFIIGYGLTTYTITRPIELSGRVDCSSGTIGVDYQSYYNDTLKIDYADVLHKNYYSPEKVGWTPKVFNLKGIDNLNCKIEFSSKGQISDLIKLQELMNNGK